MSQPPPERRRGLALGLAAAGVAAGALVLWLGGGAKAPPRPAPESFVSLLNAQLRETAAALHARVQTLAELPRLAAAVSTDAATVRDLTDDELALRPRAGETLTIAQLPQRGAPQLLLVLPAGAEPGPLVAGRSARLVGRGLVLREALVVTARDRADELHGLLAAAWMVDTKAVTAALAQAGVGAALTTGGANLLLAEPPPGGTERRYALDAEVAPQLELVVSEPAPPPAHRPWPLAAALTLVGFGAAAWAGRRRPAADDDEPPTEAPRPAPAEPSTRVGRAISSSHGDGATANAHFGRYTLVRRLGTGGMADVYLARVRGEAGFEKTVALKIMKPEIASIPGALEHLLDEARLASRLDHPNIVQVIDLGRNDDGYFIAMEYLDGPDLENLMERTRARGEAVPLDIALSILVQVCAGLHAAHTAQAQDGTPLALVHRDVKAANVLVARNGAVKVADFGIATAAPAQRVSRTEIGQLKGTPGYMAPEHRLGAAVDARADLYGVGAIAYELLTGTPVNLDLAVLAARGTTGWPHLPPPSRVRTDLPPPLDAVVFKALAYERSNRYVDCAALGDAFAAVAASTAPLASGRAVASWVARLLEADDPARAVSPRG